jgi:hypothetical protein
MIAGPTNAPVELARYRVSAGERILKGQRVMGVVRVTDVPADGHGRRYLVERELTSRLEVDGIVADYLDQAQRWDVVPVTRNPIDAPEAPR